MPNFQKCSTLANAGENDISFCTENRAHGAARTTKAKAVFVPHDFEGEVGNAELLRVDDPYESIIELAYTLNKNDFKPEVHETAIVHPSAVIMDNVKIGANTIVHPGAVIGTRGFGFHNKKPVPHFAGVIIGEDCEIGPNTVIAAGFLEATQLGNGCKLDSFVQIGHNCVVGNNVIFCSQSGLAGSVIVEDDVVLAGGAQVAGHLTLGKGCVIAAKAGVTKSIKPGITVAGFPAIPIEKWRRKIASSLSLS